MNKIKATLEALGIPKRYWRSLAIALCMGVAVGMISASSVFMDPDTTWLWVPFAAVSAFLGYGLLTATVAFFLLGLIVYGYQLEPLSSDTTEDPTGSVMVDEEFDA